MRKISHHVYVLPGITDEQVQRKKCEDNRDKRNETSILHAHSYGEHRINNGKPEVVAARHKQLCTERCVIYIPGEETRPVIIKEDYTP